MAAGTVVAVVTRAAEVAVVAVVVGAVVFFFLVSAAAGIVAAVAVCAWKVLESGKGCWDAARGSAYGTPARRRWWTHFRDKEGRKKPYATHPGI